MLGAGVASATLAMSDCESDCCKDIHIFLTNQMKYVKTYSGAGYSRASAMHGQNYTINSKFPMSTLSILMW